MSGGTGDREEGSKMDKDDIQPYMTGREVNLRTDEAFKILNTVDISKCCQDMPHFPKGGNVYIYRPRSNASKEDWKNDGYMWKNQGSSSLPRDKPKLKKRYFYALNPDGSSNLEFRKDAFSKLDGDDENNLTLVHYIGDTDEANLAIVEEDQLDDIHLVPVEETGGAGDQDLEAIQKALQAKEVAMKDAWDAEASGSEEKNKKLKDAMETMKAALSDTTPNSPVVKMFNQLLDSVYSDKSDGKSSKSSEADAKPPAAKRGRRSKHKDDEEEEEEEETQIRRVTPRSKVKLVKMQSPRSSRRLAKKGDTPNWREIIMGKKKSDGPQKGRKKRAAAKKASVKKAVKKVPVAMETDDSDDVDDDSDNSDEKDDETEDKKKTDAVDTPKLRGRPAKVTSSGPDEKKPDVKTPSGKEKPSVPQGTGTVGRPRRQSNPPEEQKDETSVEASKKTEDKPDSGSLSKEKTIEEMETDEPASADSKSPRKVVIVRRKPTEEEEEMIKEKEGAKGVEQTPKGRGRPRKESTVEKVKTKSKEKISVSMDSEEEMDQDDESIYDREEEDDDDDDEPKAGPSSTQTTRGRGRPKGSLNKPKTPTTSSSSGKKPYKSVGRPKGTVVVQRYYWEEVQDRKEMTPPKQSLNDFGSVVDSSSGRRSTSRQTAKHECVVCKKKFIVEYLLEEHLKLHPKGLVESLTPKPPPEKIEKRGRKRKSEIARTEKKSAEKKQKTSKKSKEEMLTDEEEEEEEEYSDDMDESWDEGKEEKKKKKIKLMSLDDEVKLIKKRGRKKKFKSLADMQPKPICRECGKMFETEDGYEEHRLVHIESVVSCPHCKKYFETEEYVLSHVQNSHPDLDLDETPIDFTERYFNVVEVENMDTDMEREVIVGLERVQKQKTQPEEEEEEATEDAISQEEEETKEDDSSMQEEGEGEKEDGSSPEEKEGKKGDSSPQEKEGKEGDSSQKEEEKKSKKFKCNYCEQEFNMEFSRRRHHVMEHEFENWSLLKPKHHCSVCQRTFKTELSLMVHKVIHTQGDVEEIVCEICHEEFATKGDMRHHRKEQHDITYGSYLYFGYLSNKEAKIICEICASPFDNMAQYHTHRPTHLIYQFNCQFCGHGFHDEVKYTAHVASKCKESEPHLPCGLCEQKFSHYDTRRKHIKAVHNTKATDITCHQCGLGVENMGLLRDHLATHDTEKIFKCEFCDKGFLEKRNLISHRDLHRGTKDHRCLECGRKYFSRKGLQRHMHAHLGLQKYECRFCGKRFIYNDDKTNHEKIHGEKGDGVQRKEFVCNVCGKAFLMFNRLKRHLQVHNTERIYECDVCEKKFQTTSTLRTHRIVRHFDVLDLPNLKKLICEICGYMTYQRPRLRRHMQVHNTNKEFGCEECGKKFQTSSSLNSHKSCHRPKAPITPDELLPCTWEDCKKVFSKKVGLRRHLMSHVWRVKKGRDKCKCTTCHLERIVPGLQQQIQGEVVLSRDSVSALISEGKEIEVTSETATQTVQHIQVEDQSTGNISTIVVQMDEGSEIVTAKPQDGVIEEQMESNTEEAQQAEAMTGESVQGQQAAGEQHSATLQAGSLGEGNADSANDEESVEEASVATQTKENEDSNGNGPERKFDCPKCHLSFVTACQVVKHVITHKSTKYPTCEICGNSYLDKRNLIEHMSIHSGERPFECETCGKKFRTKASWRQHRFIHAKIKPYICNFCGHGFTQKGFFDEHLRRHTGERPFTCQVCKRGFVSKDLLRRHMYSHTGNKPHQCNLCGKSFVENMQLVVHIRTHNDDRPFKCPKCEKAFFVNSKLQRHLTTVHKVDRRKVTSYVPTKINQGLGWRHKSKMKDFPKGTKVVYVDHHGQIVSEFKAAEDIKQEQEDYESYVEEEEEMDELEESQDDTSLPTGPLEVRTRRDSSGNIQILAKTLPSEGLTVLQQATNTVMANPSSRKGETVIQVIKTSSGEYIDASYLQAQSITTTDSQVQDNHIEIITQALAGAQAQMDADSNSHIEVITQEEMNDGHIEVITQEVGGNELQADSDGNIEVYTQADISQLGDGTENFSINIGEDGTVDVSDFEKIEALRHLYGSANSDEPIVIVLESQQQ